MHRPILVVFFSCGAALAQASDQNEIGMWDRNVEFTSRGRLSSNAGFLSQKLAWGQVAGLTHVSLVRYVVQDQDTTTQEPFDVGFTGTNNQGLPDYANTRFYATNLRIPHFEMNPWLVTHNFDGRPGAAKPFPLPNDGVGVHHCWRLEAAPNWVTDGLSVHMSQAAPYNNTLLCYVQGRKSQHREIPRTEGQQIVAELGWSEVPSGNPSAMFLDRAWRLEIGSPTATLEGGAANSVYNCLGVNDPNRGYASLDPDFDDVGRATPPRYDDYSWFIEAGPSHAGGIAVLFHSLALAPYPGGGISLPGIRGKLMLDVGDPLFALFHTTALDTNGSGRIDLGLGPATSPLRRLAASLPSWASQALVVKSGPGGIDAELTNLFTMRPRKGFAGSNAFRHAQLDTAAPLTIPRTPGSRSLYLRNDGHGTVQVRQYANSVVLPGEVTVGDRSAMRIPLLVTTTRLVVTTKITRPTAAHPGVSVLYGFDR